MLYLLSGLRDSFGPLRLFEYVTFRAGCALVTAMFLCLIFGPAMVRFLKKFSVPASARLEGLVKEEFIDHSKDKTPSMGGLLIVGSITVSTILWGNLLNPLVPIFLAVLLSLALLGFIDDYLKVKYKRNIRDGVSGKVKLLVQFAVAVIAVYFFDLLPVTGSIVREMNVPLMKDPMFLMPLWVALIFCGLVVTGSSNAVNLTDGKDGLAAGCTIFCVLAYAMIAYMSGHKIFAEYLSIPFIPGASEVGVFACSIAGACIGFLWYNCHPASMFMGDTGSLPLGGTIGLIAVLVGQELLLLVVGFVFVMEAGSVMLQVASFKLFKKRIFKCTPIHHHFEQMGWTENQIVTRFWIIAGFCALVGFATLKLR